MTLLFRLAQWHALAKLRMHTEPTLTIMESVTAMLGRELRRFRDITCAAFTTVELPKETAARGRRETRRKANPQAKGSNDKPVEKKAGSGTSNGKPVPRKRGLNLLTYKVHALGDYVRNIRMFGTTDSYSTQTVMVSVFLVVVSCLMSPVTGGT
jgi:hypothetical protein